MVRPKHAMIAIVNFSVVLGPTLTVAANWEGILCIIIFSESDKFSMDFVISYTSRAFAIYKTKTK